MASVWYVEMYLPVSHNPRWVGIGIPFPDKVAAQKSMVRRLRANKHGSELRIREYRRVEEAQDVI